jgi:GT2 family glycosyltransferase
MKIAAAIVTHNRLQDLQRCVQSLRNQTTTIETIIVVNNSSTDGTTNWLASQKDLHIVHQRNEGSAGGFYTAISVAKDLGQDLVYCVDDDCIVAGDAIAQILLARNRIDKPNEWILTSYVHDPLSGNYGPLADFLHRDFSRPPVRCFYKPEELPPSHVWQGVYLNWGHFFLGVLIPLKLISRVGLPDKQYFIRGEDYEYLLRCLQYSRVGCVLASRVNHGMSAPGEDCAHKRLNFKGYLQMRNHLYINRLYYRSWRNSPIARVLKYTLLAADDLVRGHGIDYLKALAFFDALTGNFGRFQSASGTPAS